MIFVKKQKAARTFVAVEIAAGAKREIRKLTERYEKFHWPVGWEKPEKIHITLLFLGSLAKPKLPPRKEFAKQTPRGRHVIAEQFYVPILRKAVEKGIKEIKPFEVSFKGLGAFPDFVQPRVVWVGLKGDLKSLAFLQKQIGRELEKAKIWFDKKPFVPHMTIGRVKKGISQGALRDLGKKIKKLRQIDFKSRVLINSIDIMKSELLPGGSVYKVEDKIRFYGV